MKMETKTLIRLLKRLTYCMAISKQRKYVEIKDNDYINCENISSISPVYISLCTHTHTHHTPICKYCFCQDQS